MTNTKEATIPKFSIWQIAMLFLCVYVLIALFIDTIFNLPPETSALLTQIDNFICIIFLADFLFNIFTAKNKLNYLKWGWGFGKLTPIV